MFKKMFKKYKLLIFISIILTVIVVASMLVQPIVLTKIINDAIVKIGANREEGLQLIDYYGTILIILALIALVAGGINAYFSAKIAQSIGADVREEVFSKVQNFSVREIDSWSSSNLVVRMTNDITQIQNLLLMSLQSLIRIPLIFIGSFIMAVIYMPELWWIIIVEIILIVVVQMFINLKTFPKFKVFQRILEKINHKVKDSFVGARVVKSFVKEGAQIDDFEVESKKLEKVTFKIGTNFSLVFPFFMFVGNLAVVVAIFFAKDLVASNMNRLGDLVSYINYLFQIMFALIIGGFLMMMAGRAAVSLGRIKEVLNFEESMNYTQEEKDIEFSEIEFKNVSFKYNEDDDIEVLKDLNFKISKGETVGIVGETGSGKTTLVNILARLYDPSKGEVLINGVSIADIPKNQLRDNISYVLQKAVLFAGTVESNIRDGNLNATDIEVKRSAEISQGAEFINNMKNNYKGMIYERGANLSGGQKQRISIARGLVKNPKILILDDYTSALDANSESLVVEGINRSFDKNIIKVIVSSKISSIVDADSIIVMDEGKIVGYGRHNELKSSCAKYIEIVESQKGVEE